MVKGLEIFQSTFADYRDCYVLIGGSACDINFSAAAVNFRVTHDLDIVLCVEALTPRFFNRFWEFIRAGGYQHRERSDGGRQFYRFTHPTDPGYPRMLEIFSRKPAILPNDLEVGHLTPIPAGEEASSLSAILLNDHYYEFVMEHRTEIDGVSVITPVGLIMLKAVAWLDLTRKKASGEIHVDSKDINKHKNDIARLTLLTAGLQPVIPEAIHTVMSEFFELYQTESIQTSSLQLPLSEADVKTEIRRLFNL